MGDLRGRINSLREEILEELQKRPEELQAEKVLELCNVLDKLIVEYISSV
ncbi:MAG TPA: Spo0E family sporulation regulatory protein-aspartic acid phosphatase [Bacillota bacterium]|nr:Spo0E family sporulation regulatory protein-aspartic acid phosphatase [Bacillota bacterium]HQA47360.1 Spo0E family sporulation regulatory protein-aspartic acid phosphatase [Bacillota bacterium]